LRTSPFLNTTSVGERLELVAAGPWIGAHADALEQQIRTVAREAAAKRSMTVDVQGIEQLDTFGAWLIERLIRSCEAKGQEARVLGLPDRYRGLLDHVHQANRRRPSAWPTRSKILASVEAFGRRVGKIGSDLVSLVAMFGALASAVGRVLVRPRAFRITSAVHHLDRVGWRAVPIILLITFLIGCIISQQGFFHFRKFGADDYVVDLVGILVLRELGVLIVAIMVAGRSGSSYTAELGSMKMREEIDALRTMGLDPVEILILPRVIALVCALPMLTLLGSLAALYGGGLVAWLYGGMSPAIFIARLQEAVSVTHFEVGIIKAPFMALVIGAVACDEGLRVGGSAESLGLQTTTSVVKSIFLVIVLDGMFAMFFASIGM
jgi:phospholipid/cholesterol/gamma-HCH transport system permease protein